jgi:hypothetical protein
MRLDPKPAPMTRDCKLKRVYPRLPLHVHSAGQKGLAETAAGNPARQDAAKRPSEWRPDRLRIRLQHELSSDAWTRLESVARARGTSIEDLLATVLAEAS